MTKKIIAFVLLFLFCVPVAFVFAGFADWYFFHYHGNPPFFIAWQFWNEGNLQQKIYLLRFAGAIYLLLTALIIAGTIRVIIVKKRLIYGRTKFANSETIRKLGLFAKQGVFIGYYHNRPLFDNENMHAMLIAATGTGKGVSTILPNLFLWNGSVIVTDPKGENFTKTSGYRSSRGQEVYCFEPFSRTTHRINPLAFFDPSNPIDHFQRLAYVLYPDPANGDKIWASSSRSLFIGLALLVLLENGSDAVTFTNIRVKLTSLDWKKISGRFTDLKGKQIQIMKCKELLEAHAKVPDKTRGGIEAEFRAPLDIFDNPLTSWATSGNDVPLEQLRKRPITLYLVCPVSNLARIQFVMRMILETVNMLHTSEEFNENPANKYKLLLLNDEQHNFYGRLEMLEKASSFYRSYGIRIYSVFQSYAQVKLDYGNDAAQAYLDNHNLRIFYCPDTRQKAVEFAKEIGETTVFSVSKSSSPRGQNSHSSAPQKREAFLPEELIKMLGTKYGLLFKGSAPPIKFRKAIWYKEPQFSKRQLPPISVPTIEQDALDQFLNTNFEANGIFADPIKALMEAANRNANTEELSPMIDALLLQGSYD